MRKLLHIIRPFSWVYLAGPYFIGTMAALEPTLGNPAFFSLLIMPRYLQVIRLIGLAYFLFPANFLLHGVAYISQFDEEKNLIPRIARTNIPILLVFIGAVIFHGSQTENLEYIGGVLIGLTAFLFLAVFYSAKPIHAKALPFIDNAFKSFYLAPGIVGFYLVNTTAIQLDRSLVIAAILWIIATNSYAAVPDIESDRAAKIPSTAAALGLPGSILYAGLLYFGAAALSYAQLGRGAILLGIVYIGLMAYAYTSKNIKLADRSFRWANRLVALALFVWTGFW